MIEWIRKVTRVHSWRGECEAKKRSGWCKTLDLAGCCPGSFFFFLRKVWNEPMASERPTYTCSSCCSSDLLPNRLPISAVLRKRRRSEQQQSHCCTVVSMVYFSRKEKTWLYTFTVQRGVSACVVRVERERERDHRFNGCDSWSSWKFLRRRWKREIERRRKDIEQDRPLANNSSGSPAEKERRMGPIQSCLVVSSRLTSCDLVFLFTFKSSPLLACLLPSFLLCFINVACNPTTKPRSDFKLLMTGLVAIKHVTNGSGTNRRRENGSDVLKSETAAVVVTRRRRRRRRRPPPIWPDSLHHPFFAFFYFLLQYQHLFSFLFSSALFFFFLPFNIFYYKGAWYKRKLSFKRSATWAGRKRRRISQMWVREKEEKTAAAGAAAAALREYPPDSGLL